LEEERERWVSMRSLLDVWAYGALASERPDVAGPLEEQLFEHLTAVTRLLMHDRYDVLFYLPPKLPLVGDAVRSDDPAFQTAVDVKIRHQLKRWSLEHVELDVTQPTDIRTALAIVEGLSR
jgi:hypothetical protein